MFKWASPGYDGGAKINLNRELELHNGTEFCHEKYPLIWLRDNCPCSKCFHPVSKGRLLLMKDLNLDVTPKSVEILSPKDHRKQVGPDPIFSLFQIETECPPLSPIAQVQITWNDGHVSSYDSDWLLHRSFSPPELQSRLDQMTQEEAKTTWDSTYGHQIKTYDFQSVMSDDHQLLKWLQDLRRHGLTLLTQMERTPETLNTLVKRIGFAKPTHYGTEFSVVAKDDPNNLAYTNRTLGLHMDLPFYSYSPSVQFLHCVTQHRTSGGENEFVDGFHLARILRESHPDTWELLKRTRINFWDAGVEKFSGEFLKHRSIPTFELDDRGEVIRVNFNNQVRNSVQNVPLDQVQDLYQALILLNDLAYEPSNTILYKLAEGECVIFDNQRVLHGRRGYSLSQSGHRHLQGCYMDWDEVISKINVLKHRLE
eukprot:maker-scaffold273_size229271-snap-gene-1.25 protein:Tk00750 transcript:maker-scaffold273_size229271-snap-gene-1.25-mRNA-1 annotation:"gamma-butyrobetaine dioxygenase-like"